MSNKKGRNDEEKLKLLLDYVNETGKKITSSTEYNGEKLGIILNNTKAKYEKHGLDVNDALVKECIDKGILVRERKKRTTQKDKYDFLAKMASKDLSERNDMENGFSFDEARRDLQVNYNRGTLNLTPEQIDELKAKGIIRFSKEELKNIQEKTGLSQKVLFYVMQKYGSIDEFSRQCKLGNIEFDSELAKKIEKIHKDFQLKPEDISYMSPMIVISENDITKQQRKGCNRLAQAILGVDDFKAKSKNGFMDLEIINDILNTLGEKEEEIIRLRLGIDGKNPCSIDDLTEVYGLSRERIKQIEAKAFRKLRNPRIESNLILFNEEELNSNIEEKTKKINELKEKITKELQNEGIEEKISFDKLYEFTNYGNILEDLDLSVRSFNCLKRNGIHTVEDLLELSEDDIRNINNLSSKNYEEIASKINELRANGKKQIKTEQNLDKDTQQVIKRNDTLNEYISEYKKLKADIIGLENKKKEYEEKYKEAYDRAYDFFINEEDIFDQNQIIPASKKVKSNDGIEIENEEINKTGENEQIVSKDSIEDGIVIDEQIMNEVEETNEYITQGQKDQDIKEVDILSPHQERIKQLMDEIITLEAERNELSKQIEDKEKEIENSSSDNIQSKKDELKKLVDMNKFNEISIVLELVKEIEIEKARKETLVKERDELMKKLQEKNLLLDEKKSDIKNIIDGI